MQARTVHSVQSGDGRQQLNALGEWARYCTDRKALDGLFVIEPGRPISRTDTVEYIEIAGRDGSLYLWRSNDRAGATTIRPDKWADAHYSPVSGYDLDLFGK